MIAQYGTDRTARGRTGSLAGSLGIARTGSLGGRKTGVGRAGLPRAGRVGSLGAVRVGWAERAWSLSTGRVRSSYTVGYLGPAITA